MQPWHVTWSTEGRHPIFATEAHLYRAVVALGEVAGEDIVLFCIVDEHVHVVFYADRATLHRRIRGLTRVLRRLACVKVEPARIRKIGGRKHMLTVLDYVLQQPEKHELPGHSALWGGGCLPDLVGARVVPRLNLQVRRCLPRFRLGWAFHAVKISTAPLDPMPIERLAQLGPARLADAACFALCVASDATDKGPATVMARRSACVLAREGGLDLAALAAALGVTAHTARRLARDPLPPKVRRAVLLCLALRERVHQAGPRPEAKERR